MAKRDKREQAIHETQEHLRLNSIRHTALALGRRL